LRQSGEESITRLPGGLFDSQAALAGQRGDVNLLHRAGDTPRRADLGDVTGILVGFPAANAVVEVRGVQRHAVIASELVQDV
jgi:hypothetical protein